MYETQNVEFLLYFRSEGIDSFFVLICLEFGLAISCSLDCFVSCLLYHYQVFSEIFCLNLRNGSFCKYLLNAYHVSYTTLDTEIYSD